MKFDSPAFVFDFVSSGPRPSKRLSLKRGYACLGRCNTGNPRRAETDKFRPELISKVSAPSQDSACRTLPEEVISRVA